MAAEEEEDGRKMDRHASGCTHSDANTHFFHTAAGGISREGES